MPKWLTLLSVLCFVFVKEAQGGLRSQFLRKPIYVKNEAADPGEPLFLTPYVKKQEFQTGKVVIQYCNVTQSRHVELINGLGLRWRARGVAQLVNSA